MSSNQKLLEIQLHLVCVLYIIKCVTTVFRLVEVYILYIYSHLEKMECGNKFNKDTKIGTHSDNCIFYHILSTLTYYVYIYSYVYI